MDINGELSEIAEVDRREELSIPVLGEGSFELLDS
jgi:hypothetical protein